MDDEIEIVMVKLQMDKVRRRGHWQAYNDLKKHYDKLVAEKKRHLDVAETVDEIDTLIKGKEEGK